MLLGVDDGDELGVVEGLLLGIHDDFELFLVLMISIGRAVSVMAWWVVV